jgi:polyhydroxyalkanoate synthesis regulator phasin
MASKKRTRSPLDVVVLTRDRLQEVLDDAVDRGRMTRDDATLLLTELVARGRRQVSDLLHDGSVGGIDDYDELTAAQVTARLDDLPPADLRRVREHERRNANRKSVLAAVDRKLG